MTGGGITRFLSPGCGIHESFLPNREAQAPMRGIRRVIPLSSGERSRKSPH